MRLTSFLYEKIYGYTKIHNLLNWLGVIGGKKITKSRQFQSWTSMIMMINHS